MPSRKSHKAASAAAEPALEMRVLRQFRVIFNAVKTHFRQVEREAGIGGAQLWALSLIRAAPGIGVNELSRALEIHQSTASNLVKGLIERGLVQAHRNEADRRTVSLRILESGALILANAPGPFAGVLPTALARVDPERLARMEQDLAMLIELLAADDEARMVPLAEL